MNPNEEAYLCGKCGICIQSCPVYREDLNELTTPRGKVQLIRHYAEKNLPASKHLKQVVSKCLMCGSCNNACPSGIDHESLFMGMRSSMAEEQGEDWKKKIFFHLLTHEQQMKAAVRIAEMGQNAVFEKLYKDIRLGNIRLSSIPRLNRKPFRESFPEITEPSGGNAWGTVLYFVGCATNYVFARTGRASVKVLSAMGLNVIILRGQTCCGLPVYLKGGLDKSLGCIENNMALLNRDDVVAVITDCSTCHSALTSGYVKVLKQMGKRTGLAERLAEKTEDIARFALKHFSRLEGKFKKKQEKVRVTYHAPCHERNHGGSLEVLKLLKSLPNIEYAHAENYDSCCGGGGTFFCDFPGISKKMTDKKLEEAKRTGAQFWVSGCPGCIINLGGCITDGELTMIHPAELLADAIYG